MLGTVFYFVIFSLAGQKSYFKKYLVAFCDFTEKRMTCVYKTFVVIAILILFPACTDSREGNSSQTSSIEDSAGLNIELADSTINSGKNLTKSTILETCKPCQEKLTEFVSWYKNTKPELLQGNVIIELDSQFVLDSNALSIYLSVLKNSRYFSVDFISDINNRILKESTKLSFMQPGKDWPIPYELITKTQEYASLRRDDCRIVERYSSNDYCYFTLECFEISFYVEMNYGVGRECFINKIPS